MCALKECTVNFQAAANELGSNFIMQWVNICYLPYAATVLGAGDSIVNITEKPFWLEILVGPSWIRPGKFLHISKINLGYSLWGLGAWRGGCPLSGEGWETLKSSQKKLKRRPSMTWNYLALMSPVVFHMSKFYTISIISLNYKCFWNS